MTDAPVFGATNSGRGDALENAVLIRSVAGLAAGVGFPQFSAFIVAQSAFRRGLAVTFLRSLPQGEGAPSFARDGSTAEVFRVSDGRRKIVFHRTETSLVDPVAAARSHDKAATRAMLARAGLRVPQGIVVKPQDIAAAQAFLSASKADRFVVKPLDASMVQGVLLDLTAAEVITELRASKRDHLLVEEYITGTELRVTVVGGRVADAFIRHPASVIGDGVHSIEELAEIKSAARLKKDGTVRSIFARRINLKDEDKQQFLARAGRKISDIPAAGETVVLTRYRDGAHGADFTPATHLLNDSLKRVCETAAQVANLPVTGIDLLISDNPTTPGSFILELNERPTLGNATIEKSVWTALGDAIIDFYFPDSVQNPREPSAVFDYKAIVDAMRSTGLTEIALPQLTPDWQHLRVSFRSEAVCDVIKQRLLRAGAVLIDAAAVEGTGRVLDILLSPRCRMFLSEQRPAIARLAPELDAAIRWPDMDETRATFRAETDQTIKALAAR